MVIRAASKSVLLLAALLTAVTFALAAPALATDSSWKTDANGNWSDAAKWTAGIPNAIGDIARLTYNITAPRTVTLDGSTRTVGSLYLNDDNYGYALAGVGLKLDVGSGSALIQSDGGTGVTHTISAPVALYDSTTVAVNSATLQVSGVISSSVAGTGVTKTGAGTLTFTAANSFSGPTTVSDGTLSLSGASGAITSSTGSIAVNAGGVLKLDNTSTANNGSRLVDTVVLTMNGGTLTFSNDGGAANFSETIGQLNLASGASTIATSQAASGKTATLTFGASPGIVRAAGAAVNFTGTGLGADARNTIVFTTAPTLDDGIIGSWAISGNDFAKYITSPVTSVAPLASGDYYTGASSSWASTHNVKLTGGSTSMSDSKVINSLNIAQVAPTTLSIGSNLLRVESGGILISGNYPAVISGYTKGLTAGVGTGAGELVIHQNSANDVTISVPIVDNGASAVSLTKAGTGAGSLILSGRNAYSGPTVIASGRMKINDLGALGSYSVGTTVMNGATLELGSIGVSGYMVEPLTLSGTGVSNSGALRGTTTCVFDGPITLAGDARINADSGTTLTLSRNANPISGNHNLTFGGDGNVVVRYYITINPGSLTKDGAGTLELQGSNSYSGATYVNSGVVRVRGFGALGFASGVTVASGAAVELGADPASRGVSLGNSLVLNGTGVANGGALRHIGGGVDNTWFGTITLASDARINSDSYTLNLAAAQAVVATNRNLALGGAGNTSITGTVALGVGSLTKDGGGAAILSAANSWTNGTIINGGHLVPTRPEALGGTTARDVTINSSGVLRLGYATSIQGLLNGRITTASTGSVLAAAGTSENLDFATPGLGIYFGVYGGGSYAGTITPGASTYRLSTSSTWSLPNQNALTGTRSVVVGGPGEGALYLLNTNDYTGSTTLQNGWLAALVLANGGVESSIGKSSNAAENLVLNGGGLRYVGAGNTVIDRNYTTQGDFGFDVSGLGTLEVTGNMTAAQTANVAMTLQGTGIGVLSGGIRDSPDPKTTKVLKAGTGTWILIGPNTYSGGTQVDGGVLRFNSAGAIGGTARNVTVNASGAVALGFGPIQSILSSRVDSASTGTVALAADSSENLDFSAAGANLTAAFLGAVGNVNCTGTLTPNGTTYRLGGGGGTLTMGNTNALTGSGKSLIVGGGAGGTVVLGAANNYTGGTTINAGGTLSVSNAAQLGSGSLTFNGGTLRITGVSTFSSSRAIALNADAWVDATGSGTLAGAITGSKGLNVIGTGTLTISGGAANTYAGGANIYSGTAKLGADDSLGNGDARIHAVLDLNAHNQSFTTLNGNGIIDNTSGAGTYTVTVGTWTYIYPDLFSGSIKNTSGTVNFTKIHDNDVVLKTLTNTFTGALTVKMGYLNVYSLSDSGVGSNGTGTITLGDPTYSVFEAGLSYFGGPVTISRTLDLAGEASAGFHNYGSGPVHLTGGMTASGSGAKKFYLGGDSTGDNTLSGGVVDSASGAINLFKAGSGTWVLSGANTYTGGTTVQGGILAIDNDNNLGAAGGITLAYGGGSYLTVLQFREPITSSRPITLAANDYDDVVIDTDYSATLSGLISGTGALKKTGSGTLTLNGSVGNTYSARTTELNGGTLLLDFANMATPTNLLPTSTTFCLCSGTLQVLGNSSGTTSQTFTSTYTGGGDSKMVVDNHGGGGTTVNLGTLDLNPGSVDFTLPGGNGKITTTTGNSSTYGILGGEATVSGNTWAYATGTSSPYTIAGLPDSAYSTTLAANANIDVKSASPISVGADTTVSTLRFNDGSGPASVIISAGKKLTIRMSGILVTGAVGGDPQITGGSIGPYSSGDITIIQNSTGHDLTINSAIQGNTTGTDFTKSGPGKVVLTGAVTVGSTYVHAGTLGLTGTGTIANTYTITIGTAAAPSPLATMTIDSPGASISAAGLCVGNHGNAVFAQSAGTVNVGSLDIAQTTYDSQYMSSCGTYVMSGGTLNVLANAGLNQRLAVGGVGEGTLDLSGTAQVNTSNNAWMFVGRGVSSVGTVTQSGDSVVNIAGSGALAIGWNGRGTYTQEGNSQVNVGGQVLIGTTSIGTYNLNGGTLTAASIGSGGMWTVGGIGDRLAGMFTPGSSLNFGGGTFKAGAACSITAPITVGAGGGTIDTNGNEVRLSQPVSGPGTLTKAATGGTLVMTGTNTFTGGLRVNGGKVIASGPSPLGTGTVTVGPGAVLSLDSTQGGLLGEYYNNQWTPYDFSTLANVNSHFAGKTPNVVVASTDRGKANFDFGLDGSGFPAPHIWDPFTKHGAEQFEVRWTGKFNAPNDGFYTFTTYSDESSMVFIDGNVVANLNSAGTPRSSSTVPLRASSAPPFYLTAGLHDIVLTFTHGQGDYYRYYGYYVDVTLPGQAQQRLSNSLLQHSVGGDATVAALAGSGSITLGSHTLTIDGGNSQDFASIISGSGGLVKTGAGTQTLSGMNTYTGPTRVNQGSLIIGLGGSLASSSITVTEGAALGGGGTILGDLVVGGTLSPGESPGILSVEDITFVAGSILNMELGGTVRGTGYDVLASSGNVTIQDGSTLSASLINAFTPELGYEFDILDFASLSGQFTTINLPALADGLSWSTDDLYLDGTIGVTPEPATLGLLALGGFTLLRRRRAGSA